MVVKNNFSIHRKGPKYEIDVCFGLAIMTSVSKRLTALGNI